MSYIPNVNTTFLSRWVKVSICLSSLNYSNGPLQGEVKAPPSISRSVRGQARKEFPQILGPSKQLLTK